MDIHQAIGMNEKAAIEAEVLWHTRHGAVAPITGWRPIWTTDEQTDLDLADPMTRAINAVIGGTP